METLASMASGFLVHTIATLVVLTVVVFVHEYGHFQVARWCNVNVKAFSIGFGREIGGFTDRHGTRWKFSWIPLGGYVRFMDDDNPASVPSREAIEKMSAQELAGSFHAKPIWQKAAVVVAGPVANFLLAIVIFTLWFWINGVIVTEPRVAGVVANGPAAKAGFQTGDIIKAIDRVPIEGFGDIRKIVNNSIGAPLNFDVMRDGKPVVIQVTPELTYRTDDKGDRISQVLVGIEGPRDEASQRRLSLNLFQASGRGVQETWQIITTTVIFLRDWVSGKRGGEELGGIVRIADAAGRVAEQGPHFLVILIATLSVGIGFINLLPIPLLDGGHLMLYGVEAVRGTPLSERAQEASYRVGFVVIIALMLFAFRNDLPIIQRWLGGAG